MGGSRTCPERQLVKLVVYKVIPLFFEGFHVSGCGLIREKMCEGCDS